VGSAFRGGEGSARARGGRHRHQAAVEIHERLAVEHAGAGAIAVHRLDGRLQLESAERRPERRCASQQRLALGDEFRIPQRGVLLIEPRPGVAHARGRPRLGEGEQRGEAPRLGFVAEQGGGEHGQPACLVGDRLAVPLLLPQPVDRVGAVDRLEHGGQSRRHLGTRRNAERDARIPDAALRPHQPLRHGAGIDVEYGGDACRVETEHRLQHERGADARVDRRVRAGEQQLEPPVGDALAAFHPRVEVEGRRHVGPRIQRHRGATGCGAEQVAQAVAGHGDQPPLRVRGNPLGGPAHERPLEGVGECILGEGQVAGAGGEHGDEPPVGVPRRPLDGPLGRRHQWWL